MMASPPSKLLVALAVLVSVLVQPGVSAYRMPVSPRMLRTRGSTSRLYAKKNPRGSAPTPKEDTESSVVRN